MRIVSLYLVHTVAGPAPAHSTAQTGYRTARKYNVYWKCGKLRRNRKWFRLFAPRVRGTSDIDNGEFRVDSMWVDDNPCIVHMSVESCRPPSVSV